MLSVVGGTPTPLPMTIGLDADVETHIGNRLRAMYDSVLSEPIPTRFLDLLHQLDDKISAEAEKRGTARPQKKPDGEG